MQIMNAIYSTLQLYIHAVPLWTTQVHLTPRSPNWNHNQFAIDTFSNASPIPIWNQPIPIWNQLLAYKSTPLDHSTPKLDQSPYTMMHDFQQQAISPKLSPSINHNSAQHHS